MGPSTLGSALGAVTVAGMAVIPGEVVKARNRALEAEFAPVLKVGNWLLSSVYLASVDLPIHTGLTTVS